MKWSKVLIGTFLAAASAICHAANVEWEIGNRFRSFDYLTTESHDPLAAAQLFDDYAPRDGEDDLRLWFARLVKNQRDPSRISPYSRDAGPWNEDSKNGHPRYVKDFVALPREVTIRVSLRRTSDLEVLPEGACEVRSGDRVLAEGPCNEKLSIERFDSAGAEIEVRSNGNQLARTSVKPRLRVILGLGDSYAAGEGAPDSTTTWASNINDAAWPLGAPNQMSEWAPTPASWYSNRCNRSFFSPQSMLSLKLARQDKHSVVAFVHLACAGAEVIDGLLAQQRMAPGHGPKCQSPNSRKGYNDVDSKCDVPVSQLRAAVELLCQTDTVPPSHDTLESIKQALHGIRANPRQIDWITNDQLPICPKGNLVTPDLVLLGVGGNDVGFAGVIAWGLVPVGSLHRHLDIRTIFQDMVITLARGKAGVICPKEGLIGCTRKELPAYARIQDLPRRYDALALAFDNLLGVRGRQIVLPNYPNPLFDENGALCGNPPRQNRNNQWYATRMLIPVAPQLWQINLTKWEAQQVDKYVVAPLNHTVFEQAQRHGWMSPDVSMSMSRRGWCTGTVKELPPPNKVSQWHGYVDRTRMIRTSNDSVLTQWAKRDREDWLAGTFHPNGWGYAAIAETMSGAIATGGGQE